MRTSNLTLAQVAFVGGHAGLGETVAWYESVLGFTRSGGLRVEGGPDEADFLGVGEDPRLEMGWLVDQNDAFQVELYEFEQPRSRPKPEAWSPRDIGYSLASAWVADFDGAVGRAQTADGVFAGPAGEDGERRAMVVDPNGNLIELLERDVLPEALVSPSRPGIAFRGVRASVSDLSRSVAFFADGFGLQATDDPHVLHGSEHEALWGLAGERPTLITFRAGDLFLELAQYDDPRGAPWPSGHQSTDAGIMNVALTTADQAVYERLTEEMGARGYHVRTATMSDQVSLAYIEDDQGFSVELLFMMPSAYEEFGFWPAGE